MQVYSFVYSITPQKRKGHKYTTAEARNPVTMQVYSFIYSINLSTALYINEE
jgi:hypothetical protein